MKPELVRTTLCVCFALLTQCAPAQTGDTGRVPVTDLRVLLLAAIDAPDGSAHGLLTGGDADAITKTFRAAGPIVVEVTTLRRYAQRGCRRLKVAFVQDGVQLPGRAGAQRGRIDFGIDYCRDGRPPQSRS